ncbi:flavin reductase family protein [Gynurincola endophyticus]|uniref:flavin reductase family protein n=1 Tax=Gynurincola endophyticus TaxID=2479004 RepID=UPI000F8E9831|nr:flavin reductase family protein [Gynurincola endophyticus]
MIIELKELSAAQQQHYLQHAIAPRPIALASTIDEDGNVNLSPFSFFNLFSTNPPIVVFSPSRRVRNNTIKHTLENVQQTKEVVINIVEYPMVQQMSLSSCEFTKGVNEFTKAGFTAVPASKVKPPLVKESRINLECIVRDIYSLGDQGGAGNLVICEVIVMHIADELLDEHGKMDQTKINHVARLGANWYTKVDTDSLFEVEKPNINIGIGFDQLPDAIRLSSFLTGNDLGKLANVSEIPAADASFTDDHLTHIIEYYSLQPKEMEEELHKYAHTLLEKDKVSEAWQILLYNE